MTLYKYLTVEKADEWLIRENSILLTPPNRSSGRAQLLLVWNVVASAQYPEVEGLP